MTGNEMIPDDAVGVPCGGECDCIHSEGPLRDDWTATIQEDRIVLLCPKCEEYWANEA